MLKLIIWNFGSMYYYEFNVLKCILSDEGPLRVGNCLVEQMLYQLFETL